MGFTYVHGVDTDGVAGEKVEVAFAWQLTHIEYQHCADYEPASLYSMTGNPGNNCGCVWRQGTTPELLMADANNTDAKLYSQIVLPLAGSIVGSFGIGIGLLVAFYFVPSAMVYLVVAVKIFTPIGWGLAWLLVLQPANEVRVGGSRHTLLHVSLRTGLLARARVHAEPRLAGAILHYAAADRSALWPTTCNSCQAS